jgi:hypothetical protein
MESLVEKAVDEAMMRSDKFLSYFLFKNIFHQFCKFLVSNIFLFGLIINREQKDCFFSYNKISDYLLPRRFCLSLLIQWQSVS